jgi:thiamine-phosphate pyrophosphorylase
VLAPRLIAISDTTRVEPGALVERFARLCAAAQPGSVMLQLRDPGLPVRERQALGERLVAAAHASEQLFAVNDRIDLALLLDADGLHLGEHSVEAASARRLVGSEVWISRACHGAAEAEARGADAIVLSPVMAPRKGNPPLGVRGLESARRIAGGPPPLLYALGGVEAGNVAECLRAGADGVAAIGAALADDPLPLLSALGIRR